MTILNKLFKPGKIGKVELKNRVIMAPMGTHWSTDGYATQRHIDYYIERAKGGIGLITTEACCVQYPQGKGFQQMSVDDDKYVPGLSRIADSIKKNGAKAAIQLYHAGAAATLQLTGGLTPVAPSAVYRPEYEQTRALTADDLREIRDCFIKAAVRAQKAGFDIVELHGAHHYLLAQFHSPAWNERDDEYGGNVRNRARFTMEVVSGIKIQVPEMPVILRMNGCEYDSENYLSTARLTHGDAIEIAKLIEASGADAIHVSTFGWGKEKPAMVPASPGALLPLAASIKKAISIPVIAVGRLVPELAEDVLRQGKADFIAIGRGLLADPYLLQKTLADDIEDIAPCINCLQCLGQPRMNICTVNARNGQEKTYPYPLSKATKVKKVVVIGGGPGGMEAARVAALREHDVTLYEKDNELGGKLLVADKPSSKANMSLLKPYLERQLKKAGVKVKLGEEATPKTVLKQYPDAVIIATGAKPVRPNIKGLEKANVVDGLDLLAGKVKVSNRVVIIGGETVGCEVAEVLSEQKGKDITILRRGSELLVKTRVPHLRYTLIRRLEERGVKFQLGVTYQKANNKGLLITDKDGKEQFLQADTIILAAGAQPDIKLVYELQGNVPELLVIGDAMEPRLILQAIHEGFKVAYSL